MDRVKGGTSVIKIIELSKKYCLEAYGGDYSEMIAQGDGLVYDNGLIKRAFNFRLLLQKALTLSL